MTGRWWTDDGQLLTALGEALGAGDEVPHAFVEAGRAAYEWRTFDAELAALTYDSATDAALAAATRAGPAALRALTFATDTVSVDLDLRPDALMGQVTPPRSGSVAAVVGAAEVARVALDELGFFVLRPLPPAPFRLLIRTREGAVQTGLIAP